MGTSKLDGSLFFRCTRLNATLRVQQCRANRAMEDVEGLGNGSDVLTRRKPVACTFCPLAIELENGRVETITEAARFAGVSPKAAPIVVNPIIQEEPPMSTTDKSSIAADVRGYFAQHDEVTRLEIVNRFGDAGKSALASLAVKGVVRAVRRGVYKAVGGSASRAVVTATKARPATPPKEKPEVDLSAMSDQALMLLRGRLQELGDAQASAYLDLFDAARAAETANAE